MIKPQSGKKRMKSSKEKSLELTAAMRKFKVLETEMQECLEVLRQYMIVERRWVFYALDEEEKQNRNRE